MSAAAGAAGTAGTLPSTRRLLGASFDALASSGEEMRRASFYIGAIVVGTVAPFALATWALEVRTVHLTVAESARLADGPAAIGLALLTIPLLLGLLIAFVEGRNMAIAILGGRIGGRPLTDDAALARSRMIFGRAIGAAIVASIPLTVAQGLLQLAIDAVLPLGEEGTILAVLIASVTVGAWFAYVGSGVVLGDVRAVEALVRSGRVYRARKVAAAIVALFESAAALLILLGLSAGLDVALRLFDGLGLGADAGPAGIALVTIGIVLATFAFGTLILTVMAIATAPQVVMFVGLTGTTVGLDHVRPGGDHDPSVGTGARAVDAPGPVGGPAGGPVGGGWARPPEVARFRRITGPMWVLMIGSWIVLAAVVVAIVTFA